MTVKLYHACTDKADEFKALHNMAKWIIQENPEGYMADIADLHKGKKVNGIDLTRTNPTWQSDTWCFITNGTSI